MEAKKIHVWGTADLRGFPTPSDRTGNAFPYAVSFVVPVTPDVMDHVKNGPDQAYADEYVRVNHRIDEISTAMAAEIKASGFRSRYLAASERSDPVNMAGDFPHKTAATRAGLGWIGLHCQLITYPYGPWVRLGTVFTDMELPCGPPLEKNLCGSCRRCVDACPANALTGRKWVPGLAREDILNVQSCDQWKKEHYLSYVQGHICGICSAVCPFGRSQLKRSNNEKSR
jgi:epoxyqueuosine reductase QueG